MIPRLQAEESLRRATEHAVGSGMMKNSDRIMRDWRKQARMNTAPKSRAQSIATAESMGFGVIVEGTNG